MRSVPNSAPDAKWHSTHRLPRKMTLSQFPTPATQFARCHHLTQPWHCNSRKTRNTTRAAPATQNDDGGLQSAVPATKKCKSCFENLAQVLRLSHETTFDTLWMSRARRNQATRHLKPPKVTAVCRTRQRHGHSDLARTVANGCERLRTVANGCERLPTQTQLLTNTPSTPDPSSETGTLATHSEKDWASNRRGELNQHEWEIEVVSATPLMDETVANRCQKTAYANPVDLGDPPIVLSVRSQFLTLLNHHWAFKLSLISGYLGYRDTFWSPRLSKVKPLWRDSFSECSASRPSAGLSLDSKDQRVMAPPSELRSSSETKKWDNFALKENGGQAPPNEKTDISRMASQFCISMQPCESIIWSSRAQPSPKNRTTTRCLLVSKEIWLACFAPCFLVGYGKPNNLRRGGTKASACFLTRAGARETPPHPCGMAQTWSAPTSTIAIGS